MIGLVVFVARTRCRRRWAGLIGITILVAVFGAAVLLALVGAHRTATSLDRYREWSQSSDAEFQSDSVELAEAMKRALDADPAIRQTSLRYLANAFPISEDGTLPDIAIMTDPGGDFGVTIDRVRVLEGRMPSLDAPDEVIVNEVAASLLGVGPGDVVRVMTWSAADLEALFQEGRFPGFNGPHVDLQIVGIGRTPRDLPGELRRTDLIALASPGFLDAHPVGAWPPAVMVRLDDVDRDLDVAAQIVNGVGSLEPDGLYHPAVTTADAEYADTTRRSTNGLAIGLLIFAIVAAAAGVFATAQAAAREARTSVHADGTLAALGMRRRERTLAVALPIFGAALVGVVIAVVVAIAASPILPRGRARLAEIEPGVWVDPVVLVAGSSLLVGVVAAIALLVAGRSTRRTPAHAATSRTTLASRMIATLGLGVVTATGLRRASPDRRRAGSSTARSAMVGMTIAVAGILAAGVIVQSIDSLESDPANWGWVWTTKPDPFGDGDPMAAVADDPDVVSAGLLSTSSVVIDGTDMQGMSLASHKGDLAFTLVRGRLPSSAAEVALGVQTLRDLGVGIGDSVDAQSSDGVNIALQIVGTAVLPQTELATLDEGAVFTPDGLDRVTQGPPSPDVVLGYRNGADVAALERRLTETAGLTFPVFARARVPGSIANVAQASGIAWSLAVFFLVIGIVGLVNALTTSIRRDGHDFAILRAIGFRGRQVRQATLVQALALSAVGLVVGVPLGLIAGRAVWRGLSGGLGIGADPQVPWLLIWTVVPLTAAATALLCWWPGRFAARSRPAVQLRVE